MPSQRILRLIDDVVRRVRLLVLVVGLLTFTACLGCGFLVLGALDWLLWLPPSVRLVLTLLLLIALGYVLLIRLVRPLGAPLRRVTVANRLEERFGVLGNRLSSSVQFIEAPPQGSTQLMDEVIRRTEDVLNEFDMNRIVSRRTVWRNGAGAALPALILSLLMVFLPYWPTTALARLISPFSQARWPRSVEILTQTQNKKAPLGGSITLELQIGRGDRQNLRAFVHTSDERRRRDSFPMQRGRDGLYRWTFEGLTQDLTYWFEAGDDSTRHRPGMIQVVPRPVIEAVRIQVREPEYVGRQLEIDFPAEGGRAEILGGSRVRLWIRVSKHINQDETGRPRAWLLESDADPLTLDWASESRQEISMEFELRVPRRFRLAVEDQDEFENERSGEFEIAVRPDEAPVITVLEPTTSLDVTPQSEVAVWVSLSDDVELGALRLVSQRIDAEEAFPPLDLSAELAAADGVSPGSASAELQPGQTRGDRRDVRFNWSIGSLALKPGEAVHYYLKVSDNFGLDGSKPHTVRSAPLLLKVLSSAQFTDRLQAEFQMLRARIRELLNEQEAQQDGVEMIRAEKSSGDPLSRDALESLGRIAGAQNRLAARTGNLSSEFERTLARMRMNRFQDKTATAETARIAYDLNQLAQGPMTESARRADEIHQVNSANEQDDVLGELALAQSQSVDGLERLLQRMQRWGSFQEMVRKTAEVLDRQQELTRKTADLHRRTLGIPSDSLPESEREKAAQLSRRQRRLADEAEELVRRMSDLAGNTRESEPATSESLKSAERAARAGNLSRKLQQAAADIGRNRASGALREQKSAQEVLLEMLNRLQKRQSRRLAELARKTEQAEELIRYMLQQQMQLQTGTRTAVAGNDPGTQLSSLARDQEDLAGNTRQLAKDLLRTLDTAKPARRLRSASAKMKSAADRLTTLRAPEADSYQSDAIEYLNSALEALREVRERAQSELAKQAVLALRNQLIEIRDTEAQIADDFDEILGILNDRGRLRRSETRRLTSMVRTQERVAQTFETVLKQVEQVVVHRWLFERIAGNVTATKERIEQRLIDAETGELLGRIVDSLNRAIETLDVSDVQPEDQFAEGSSGGGSGGGSPRIKPVPTVSELKLLRRLQLDLNAQTTTLDERAEREGQSEKVLRRIQELAGEQRELRGLTGKLFERKQ